MRVLRYTLPTKLDASPYGTVCIVKGDGGKDKTYIQLSKEDHADWVYLGDILMEVFREKCETQAFIDECIEKYSKK